MNLRDRIERYLEKEQMMQLATSENDKPWCCTVYFVHGKNNELYWVSSAETRHSKIIANQPNIAVNIPILYKFGGTVISLSTEGKARRVEDGPDKARALHWYHDKFKIGLDWVDAVIERRNDYELYVMKPKHFVLFDSEHYPNEPRQELEL